MIAKSIVDGLFRYAGLKINGPDASDPQIRNPKFYRRLLLQGSIGLGDMYMEEWYTVERVDLMIEKIVRSGLSDLVPQFDDMTLKIKSRLFDRQGKEQAQQNVSDHYDFDPRFFIDVLGTTNSYTCGRFVGTDNLDEAQTKKMDILCRKVELKRGERLLDIGCGWGGFAAHAAANYGADVTGISLSEPQLAYARGRYGNLKINFNHLDYRDFKGKVDKIVSICMIEHVGPRHYRQYFEAARRALSGNGLFGLQCITTNVRSTNDAWVDKHIFPGGNLVRSDYLHRALSGLFHVLDVEMFGHDYVKTLRAWHQNLVAQKDHVIATYGIEHFRKYEYYFLAFVGSFLAERISVGQFVLCPEKRAYSPQRL